MLSEECDEEEFPELFTLILLQACMLGCPTKTPASKKDNKALQILSRKKRKIQKALDKSEANPLSTESQLQSLMKKLALIHYSIRDAIVDEKLFREEQAVGKIKTNSKYFYRYEKQYSKQKQSIMATSIQNLKRLLIFSRTSSHLFLVIL